MAAIEPSGEAVRSLKEEAPGPKVRTCGPPRIRAVGRHEETTDGDLRVGNSGSGVVARFRGREVTVLLRETVHNRAYHGRYLIRIDGREIGTLATDNGLDRYTLAAGLAPGEHTVELLRRTESFVSTGDIAGFDFGPGGALLSPPCERPRRILFVGDSVTTAFGALGDGPHCEFKPEYQDFFVGYAARAASQLHAELHTALWSGHGVSRNNDGTTTDLIPELFERAIAVESASRWDHARFRPDVVFILAGANDFKPSVPDEEQFVTAYVRFLQRVRAVHPNARLMLGLSPMMSDAWPRGEAQRSTARRYLTRVAREAGAQVVEFDEQQEQDGVGCTWHPSPSTHEKMAAALAAAIRAAMKW